MRLAEQLGSDTLYELALRLVAKHHPDALSTEQQQDFQDHLQRVYHHNGDIKDYKNQHKAHAGAVLTEIESLSEQDHWNAQQRQLLDELKQYILTQQESLLNTSPP